MILAKKTLLAVAAAGLVATSCGKKDDDSESSNDKLEVMSSINVSCGGKNCFGDDSSSLSLGNGDSFLQTMRMMTWMVVGFPTNSPTYATFTTDQKKLIPSTGMVGRLNAKREQINNVVKKNIASCSAAPASGSAEVDGLKITWVSPKLTAPAGNETTGKYKKALTATIDKVAYRFEFNCDKTSMAIASNDSNKVYNVFFYEVDSKKVMRAEMDIWGKGGLISDADINLQFMMYKDSDTIKAWLSRTGPKEEAATHTLGFRYVVAKKISADPVSFFQFSAGDGDSDYVTNAAWNALDRVKSDAVTYTGATSADQSQGCAADWDAEADYTSNTLCSGLALGSAPKTGLDKSGDASMYWVNSNLKTKISAIFK